MSDEATDEWAQLGHHEQVRRAVRKVLFEGGSNVEHALVHEVDRLKGHVFVHDGPEHARLTAERDAALARVAKLEEALKSLSYELTRLRFVVCEEDQASIDAALAKPEGGGT